LDFAYSFFHFYIFLLFHVCGPLFLHVDTVSLSIMFAVEKLNVIISEFVPSTS